MRIAQKALIAHLAGQFPAKTVREYAGDLEDANHILDILPAILILFEAGQEFGHQPRQLFNILVITESQAFEDNESTNNNLEEAEAVCRFLSENPSFRPADASPGSFVVTDIDAEMLSQDRRFTVIALHTTINQSL